MDDAHTIRVLIVDDHRMVRSGLRGFLADEPGITVVGEAASGEDAIAYLPELTPDVVLMDLMMPGISGIEAARRIYAAGDAAAIIMLTAFGDTTTRAAASGAGIALFLEKGDDLDDLAERIRFLHERTPAP